MYGWLETELKCGGNDHTREIFQSHSLRSKANGPTLRRKWSCQSAHIHRGTIYQNVQMRDENKCPQDRKLLQLAKSYIWTTLRNLSRPIFFVSVCSQNYYLQTDSLLFSQQLHRAKHVITATFNVPTLPKWKRGGTTESCTRIKATSECR